MGRKIKVTTISENYETIRGGWAEGLFLASFPIGPRNNGPCC